MIRARSFLFNIKNYKKSDWKNICSLKKEKKCEYIYAAKDKNEIRGFVRFFNPKHLNAVEKIFNNKAVIELKSKNDKYYKELFPTIEYFNSDENENDLYLLEEKNKELEERLEENQKIINIVENQNTKLMQQHNETMIDFINAFKNSKENDSEQIKQITNLCMTIAKNTPTMILNNNSTTNNNFNLNVFLNEYCKDAINIFDFAKSIQIELEDVILYKKLGHVEAVSQIFDNAYKNLDLKMRPMHCTDVKRETLYVRNDNKWVNDETKELSKKAMEKISDNSYTNFKLWKDANPDYTSNEYKKLEYIAIMKQLLGGSSDKDFDDNSKKIVKNLLKNTHLDKSQAII
jgi:hypothetical protein